MNDMAEHQSRLRSANGGLRSVYPSLVVPQGGGYEGAH